MNHRTQIVRNLFVMRQSLLLEMTPHIPNHFKNYSSAAKFENRNILKLEERGLVVGIFPDQK